MSAIFLIWEYTVCIWRLADQQIEVQAYIVMFEIGAFQIAQQSHQFAVFDRLRQVGHERAAQVLDLRLDPGMAGDQHDSLDL